MHDTPSFTYVYTEKNQGLIRHPEVTIIVTILCSQLFLTYIGGLWQISVYVIERAYVIVL